MRGIEADDQDPHPNLVVNIAADQDPHPDLDDCPRVYSIAADYNLVDHIWMWICVDKT